MARGWESKAVEAQQAEAGDRNAAKRLRLKPEEAVRVRQREGLRLSRERILAQLAVAPDPRYRKLLEATLADLDAKLQQAES